MQKIKGIKTIVSCALAVGLCGSSFVQMVSAETILPDSGIYIDKTLSEKLSSMSDEDKLDVSVWTKDIDFSTVKKETTVKLKSDYNFNSEKLELLDMSFVDEKLDNSTALKIKRIDSDVTDEDTETVIEEKRNIASDMYEENNQKFLDKIECHEDDIIYESKYAPNVILSLDKEQINSLCKNPNVTDIYYYEKEAENLLNPQNYDTTELSQEERASTYNFSVEPYDVTGISEMRDTFGFTGEGVKIGVIDYPFANSSEIDYFNRDTFALYHCSSNGIIDSYSSHGNCVSCKTVCNSGC